MNESTSILIALPTVIFGAVMLYMAHKKHRETRNLLEECRRLCERSENLEEQAKALVKLSRSVNSWSA